MKRSLHPFLFLLTLLLLSCSSSKDSETISSSHFEIENYESFKILTANQAWKDCKTPFIYILSDNPKHIPDSLKQFTIIKTPITRAIFLSSTTLAYAEELNALRSVVGVDNVDYLINDSLQKACYENLIATVGSVENLNIERILELNPEIIFTYVTGENPVLNKIQSTGIPVVYISEYLEKTALQRAEWIKFMACFYHKEEQANTIYSQVVKDYTTLAKQKKKTDSTSVLVSRDFGGNWYVPGGNSFVAQMLKDAGGKYAFADSEEVGSVPISFEKIIAESSDADIWLCNSLGWTNLDIIKNENELYTFLEAYQQNNVYNNNKRQKPHGGNDYYASAIVHPEKLLNDYILLLNSPTDTSELYYFRKLK